MIIRFAVDPEALAMQSFPAPLRRSLHDNMLRLWSRLGVLVHSGKSFEQSQLSAAIRELPQDVRKMWLAAIKQNRIQQGPPNWSGVTSLEAPEDLGASTKNIDVLCLDEVRAALLGLPEEQESIQLSSSNLELVRFDCVNRANVFLQAEELANEPIEKDTKILEVWRQRFDRLARLSRHIVLMDRFALESAHKRGDPHSGLRRFLMELNKSANTCGVVIYTSVKEFQPHELIGHFTQIWQSVPSGGVRKVQLYLVDDRDFMGIAHDRYIRFEKTVCEIGMGIDILTGQKVWRTSSFSLKPLNRVVRDVETALREASYPREVWSRS